MFKISKIFDLLVPQLFIMNSGGGGGGTQQVVQSNIPEEFYPQVRGLLQAAGRELFEGYTDPEGNYIITGQKPFRPFSTRGEDYVAGLQPGQENAIGLANWMGGPAGQQFLNEQYGRAGDFAARAGYGGEYAAEEALRYGREGSQAGQEGQRLGVEEGGRLGGIGAGYGAGAAGLAPRAAGLGGMYERMATTPGEYQKYMSPYMQNVVARQQEDATTQAKIMEQGRKAAAARAGAFGGSRRIIEQAEADKALGSQLGNIQAQGLQKAFDQAQQNINQRAQLESQGLGQAGQLYGVGIQGAQTGLQGLQQQLAGTEQGMRGAGMGLQGVQTGLGGYGLMGQMGGQLADITGRRFGQLRDVSEFQYGMGERQRQLEQQRINQMIQNYAMAQERPMTNLQMMNALLRGYAVPGTTTTQYQAPAPLGGQLAGLGTAAAGISGLMGRGAKAGGLMDAGDGVDTLALNKALAGD